jgi:hypothetical protein
VSRKTDVHVQLPSVMPILDVDGLLRLLATVQRLRQSRLPWVRFREVGRIAARRSGRGPQSGRTVSTTQCPGWEMFPVGSRTAWLRCWVCWVERTVTAAGGGSGEAGGRVAMDVGEGDGAAS